VKSLIIRDGDSQHGVVLVERLDKLNVEALLLEDVFLLRLEATEVRIEDLT
jgi:hypothetical protein